MIEDYLPQRLSFMTSPRVKWISEFEADFEFNDGAEVQFMQQVKEWDALNMILVDAIWPYMMPPHFEPNQITILTRSFLAVLLLLPTLLLCTMDLKSCGSFFSPTDHVFEVESMWCIRSWDALEQSL